MNHIIEEEIVSPVIDNECYYFIEREKDSKKLILFLLCPLPKGSAVYFSEGIASEKTWNIIMENDNANNSPILQLGKKKYSFKRFELTDEEEKKHEIVIHSYIEKGDYIYPSEVNIEIEWDDLPIYDPTNKDNGYTQDEIAYNRPYVCLNRAKFREPIIQRVPKPRLKFYPRVIIPLLGYRISKKLDILGLSNNVDDFEGKCYPVIVPLIKTKAKGIKIIEPTELSVNGQYYYDNEEIDGCLEVIVVPFKDSDSEEKFRNKEYNKENLKNLLEEARKTGIEAKRIGMSSDPITGRPKGKKAVTFPASGVFIDKP